MCYSGQAAGVLPLTKEAIRTAQLHTYEGSFKDPEVLKHWSGSGNLRSTLLPMLAASAHSPAAVCASTAGVAACSMHHMVTAIARPAVRLSNTWVVDACPFCSKCSVFACEGVFSRVAMPNCYGGMPSQERSIVQLLLRETV